MTVTMQAAVTKAVDAFKSLDGLVLNACAPPVCNLPLKLQLRRSSCCSGIVDPQLRIENMDMKRMKVIRHAIRNLSSIPSD